MTKTEALERAKEFIGKRAYARFNPNMKEPYMVGVDVDLPLPHPKAPGWRILLGKGAKWKEALEQARKNPELEKAVEAAKEARREAKALQGHVAPSGGSKPSPEPSPTKEKTPKKGQASLFDEPQAPRVRKRL